VIPTFSYVNDVFFGFGVSGKLGAILKRSGLDRPLLVTDSGLMASGIADRTGLSHLPVYDGVETNPEETQILEGLEVFRSRNCDGIVAVGGGSSIDLAKCVALLVNHEGPLEQYAILRGGQARILKEVPPIVAVPTTAGSGSEVGKAALATLQSGDKLGVLSSKLLPTAVVCDPELTFSMPAGLTAGTGMDAISHCVETYCSTRENPIADAIALDGLARGCRWVGIATVEPENRDARKEMMLCSLQGGLAFQKSLGAVHSLSHPLGALGKRLHHGTLNALFLPIVLRFNTDSCPEKIDAMAARLGLKCGEDLPGFFRDLNVALGIPDCLSAMGVTEEELEPLAEKALADHCSATNPRPLTARDCRRLYLETL
jgi:alcohol dehydrogenase class IV